MQEVLKNNINDEIFSESDKEKTHNAVVCSVNIHSFHVHCCSVLFFPARGGGPGSIEFTSAVA